MKRLLTCLGAAALAIATANLQAVPLGDLVSQQGSITWGDKLFDDWTIISNQLCPEADCIEDGINLADIDVAGVGTGSAGDEYGLSFTALNGALTQVGDTFLDLWFEFSVAVLDPTKKIVGATMTGSVDIGDASEWIIVEKFIYDFNSEAQVAFLSIESDSLLAFENLNDSAGFAGLSKIWVQDNIYVDGFEGSAQLVALTQRFIQRSTVSVPAPGTLILLALGLLGMGLVRRHRYHAG